MKIKEIFDKIKIRRYAKANDIQNKGELSTFISASAISGFVDLVFFSGLSVSLYTIFGVIAVPAGVVLCLMSLVITAGKCWCAMRVEQINELMSHLKVLNKEKCAEQLKKPRRRWKIRHILCMSISLLTAASLSVVSIGDGIRKNQNEIRKANEEISTLAELINANSIGQAQQREIIYSSVNVGNNSTKQAQEQASKIWPIIEKYRTERAEFEATGTPFDSKEEMEWKGKNIIPDEYWDKQNSLVLTKVKAAGRTLSINQIRNITSEAVLAQQIKNEIEKLNKNSSKDDLLLLDSKTKDAILIAVKNLQGRFYWPRSRGGELVVFDENNPSMALTTLKDLKAAYENDTGDVGESAKIFVLLGPAIENAFGAKATLENLANKKSVSSFDATSVMIMAFILFAGLLLELLISSLTPIPTITRNVFAKYNFDEELDIEDIMYKINLKYVSKGLLNLEEFHLKAEKSKVIKGLPKTIDDYIASETKKPKTKKSSKEAKVIEPKIEKEKEFTPRVDELVKEIEELI